MNAIYLTLFVGVVLTAFSLVHFGAAWRRKEHDQLDRLSLMPLLGDDGECVERVPGPTETEAAVDDAEATTPANAASSSKASTQTA